MRLATQPQRLLSLLIAGLAWLVLASGIGRALVVCTEACGAEHVAFAHAHGACGHAGNHAHAHAHEHEHAHSHASLQAHAGVEAADGVHDDGLGGGCEDRSLWNDAATRPGTKGTLALPASIASPRLLMTTPAPGQRALCRAATERPTAPGGARALLVLRI
jgi:hypothetical protein